MHDVFVIDVRPDPIVWVSTDAGLTRYTAAPRELAREVVSSVTPNAYPSLRVDEHGIVWIQQEGGYFESAPSDPSSLSFFLFPFEITQTEITQTQWASLTDGNEPAVENAHTPEVFEDINALVSIISVLPTPEDGIFELPSQAEWELSAQGDRLQHHALYPWTESFPFGESVSHLGEDGLRCNRALTSECGIGLSSVQSNPLGRSEQGLYGLGGNAAEWVSDTTGYRLVGGSVFSPSSMLLLSSWVKDNDPQLDSLSPATGRGTRLVIRTR